MAYFPENEIQGQDGAESWPPEDTAETKISWDDADWQPGDADEEREAAWEDRRRRWKIAAGVGDFLGVILGVIAVLVLAALLVSLVTWLQGDLDQTFTLLRRRF